MLPLIVLFRAAQLFAHAAHNTVTGPAFFGDHAFLGESYEAYEAAYDVLVEQEIARGVALDLQKIGVDAVMIAAGAYSGSDALGIFSAQQNLETRIRESIGELVASADDAGQGLLQQLAQDSLARSYKLRARLLP